jgi:DNA helicase II / ATP-dependent DNA helicase PcrA
MMASEVVKSNVAVDDHVDDEIGGCLSLTTPRSFFLFAGAGSGKTRSLVNALNYIKKVHGPQLTLRGQRVGVITYTNAACDEIISRLDFNPLFHVSTIHSFAWELIRGFDSDMRVWLKQEIAAGIQELMHEEAKGRPGTKASITRQAQIESKQRRFARLHEIKTFAYSPTGENKDKSSLNHTEVIKISASFLSKKPLMQQILVNRYPFLLIDESQDTNKHLIDALLGVEAANRSRFSLGVLGDTMQRIYSDGKENVEGEIPETWEKPKKKLNHRCPKRIVRLINRIRSEVDTHEQESRSDSIEGFVRLFVISSGIADKPSAEYLARVYMSSVTSDNEWNEIEKCKILTLEHHMSAKRMGFQNVFEPLYAVEEFRTALLEGKLSATRFFTQSVLPLVTAHQKGDKFAIAKVIRDFSPLLSASMLKGSTDSQKQLKAAREAVYSLMSLWTAGEPTCGVILENIGSTGLFAIPDSLKPLLKLREAKGSGKDLENENADPPPDEVAALERFLEAPFSEIYPYASYVANAAPFGTHQGVKGLEFDRVMVLMDDSETRGFMFGYEKFFGAKEQSGTDIKNAKEGKETSIDRTRRLFYVTCSRARKSLALVAYTTNPEAVRSHVVANGWFEPGEVILSLPS